ncbi:recombinase family protein [Actibacterium sp. 188UL27-1]|uniref:recombinase family protein n=1 Tax=Actibacterium sp. 188UL27-1 TaxID=2786961 RepID=UPI00195B5078|nr:recombinase family protein [Actibacterium sp. 188UL27-1]MBM7069949.1 recombinase family protein [Actibacterium sp. 188UL27-1]
MKVHIDRETRIGAKAVVYCRVSDPKQTTRGDGLNSQETRCREYAKYKGYEVVSVFKDDMSGKFSTRPGMKAMLSFLRQQRKDQHIVIIDDITRLARGLDAHLKLRTDISGAGGLLESPSIEFGEDSDSILVENLLASVSQHQRQKNGEQTKNRMRARLQNGYWPFQAPIGFRYERLSAGHGKVLVRDEPNASILQEALEGYANGRFQTQVEVKRFLERQPAFPKDLNGTEIRNQRIHDMMTRCLYAGYVEHADWGISVRKGQHEGLISYETFLKVQERLTSTAKAPARKDISLDFPLRGFVQCDDCGEAMTACWSKSKTGKKHPYYLCKTKGCESYRKSIKRDQLEGDFEALLQSLEPSMGLFKLAKTMFKDIWDVRLAQAAEASKTLGKDIHKIEGQIEALLDRIVESGTGSVIAAYEKRIAKLESEKVLLEERMAYGGKPLNTLEESFELALRFLSSPWNIWKNGRIEWQKTVLRLAFVEPIRYSRNQGVRTPNFSFPFKVLEGISTADCEMARWGGFEPPTP